MKATELMIGDYISVKPSKMPIKIAAVHRKKAAYHAYTNKLIWVRESLLVPIPITPETLEKNGWKREFDRTDYMVKYDLGKEGKNCWMMWSIKEHNLDIQRQDEKLDMYNLKVSRVVIPCDYVHQLQHALRLCGIEKQIELL